MVGQEQYQIRHKEGIGSSFKEIIYAGQSQRRHSFLLYLFPKIPVVCVPAGPEENTPDVTKIMRGKLTAVYTQEFAEPQNPPEGRIAILAAADTRTSIPMADDLGNFAFISRGKPLSEEAVREIFTRMYHVHEKVGVLPGYFVQSASGFLDTQTGQRVEAVSSTTVTLAPEVIKHIATEKGSEEYKKRFLLFYSGKTYADIGLQAISVTDISAGLSLPVLAQFDAISHINEVEPTDSSYPIVLKQAIYNVAVGFAPRILIAFDSEIKQKIDTWPWLNQVTEQCLRRNL